MALGALYLLESPDVIRSSLGVLAPIWLYMALGALYLRTWDAYGDPKLIIIRFHLKVAGL